MAVSNDLFMSLDESLLILILSFLPFKDAARTCVLSKQWLNLWKSTRNIEFNEHLFVKPDQPDQVRETQKRVFIDFINNWLQNYQGSVADKLCLVLSQPDNVFEVIERCVSFATTHRVKKLVLDFSNPNWVEESFEQYDAVLRLPEHFYNNRSVESLKLFSCGFKVDGLRGFYALKHVTFGWMPLRLCAVKTLLSNCGTIESLSLKKCWNLANFDMGEEALRLKRLVVDKCYLRDETVSFKAPNLKFFKYSGVVCSGKIEVNKFIMEEADLDFSLEFQVDGLGDCLYKLLLDLYPVRVLTVCSHFLQAIPLGEEPIRVQWDLNVRHLILKAAMHSNEYYGIIFLLNSCPMLETLTIEIGPGRIFADYEPPFRLVPNRFWIENVARYKCVRTTLKVVEVKGFRGCLSEIYALNYFIQCGKVLKHVNIELTKNGDGRALNEHRTIAGFLQFVRRASRNLEISIS